ncbi:hypothetical protein SBADM41S_10512 [Streptomyces badius]
MLDEGTLVVPLRAGGGILGLVTFDRGVGPDAAGRTPAPDRATTFDNGEVALADELTARTAVCIDNARRYTRERTASLALQRQLLPHHLPPRSAVRTAYRYLPADDVTGVGGDWFDVIPLSGTRVGLVVGDVVGHGLQAAATMGRLRTSVRAFAQLDMPPDELLTRLDDLVGQPAEEPPDAHGGAVETYDVTTGATCLYAVYDPVSRRCVMARAGRLPQAIVDPGGGVSFPDLPAGPPLGLGGLPFESMEFELPVGSLLALFTDGLVEARDHDISHGLDTLGRVLADRSASLEELCDRAVSELVPGGTSADDTALFLVRTRELDAERVADWELSAEPVSVGRARELATGQLEARGLGAGVRDPARRQRTGHQRGPVRGRAAGAPHHPGPHPGLRGRGHRAHLPPPAAQRGGRRGRARPVHRGAARPAVGHPLHPDREDHLDRAGAAVRRRRLSPSCEYGPIHCVDNPAGVGSGG